jgi:hypothetical protein
MAQVAVEFSAPVQVYSPALFVVVSPPDRACCP